MGSVKGGQPYIEGTSPALLTAWWVKISVGDIKLLAVIYQPTFIRRVFDPTDQRDERIEHAQIAREATGCGCECSKNIISVHVLKDK